MLSATESSINGGVSRGWFVSWSLEGECSDGSRRDPSVFSLSVSCKRGAWKSKRFVNYCAVEKHIVHYGITAIGYRPRIRSSSLGSRKIPRVYTLQRLIPLEQYL